MLYIPYKGENVAYLSLSQGVKRFDLNFEAKKTGRFTISYDTKEEFAYLHLIDKVLGKDIDLLSDGEYSFMASPVDIKDRFEVRLNLSNKPEGFENIFAYQSGGDIVVSGEGELQIFDVMGRLVATQHVTGVETVRKPSSRGVYILRLNEMSQKIVVR